MKKRGMLIVGAVALMLLSACGQEAPTQTAEQTGDTDKPSIVAMSFHEYDWTREILGDRVEDVELTLLMDNGVDIHSYEPSMEDITTISGADLFIYNGGESSDWVEELLAQPDNAELNTVCMMESLSSVVMPELAVEGMQEDEHDHDDEHEHDDEHDHDDDHDHDHDHDDHDHADTATDEHVDHDHAEEEHVGHDDEHIWLSLNNAVMACELLTDEIVLLDTENAEEYRANAAAYIERLEALDAEYVSAVAAAERDTLLFADRFPFLYLMNDYGINYYAAFQGCSAETEASFETIAFLAEKTNELALDNVMIIDKGMSELAQTVIDNSEMTEGEILELNSIQSVDADALASGVTYYSIMSENLEVLKAALE